MGDGEAPPARKSFTAVPRSVLTLELQIDIGLWEGAGFAVPLGPAFGCGGVGFEMEGTLVGMGDGLLLLLLETETPKESVPSRRAHPNVNTVSRHVEC